jgi:hypothetical protein
MRIHKYTAAGVLIIATLIMPHLAAAQSSGLGTPNGPVVNNPNPAVEKPKEPLPPAIPGSHSDDSGDNVAPSRTPALDLEPNDALFDAINRGDMAAARDAINRGADLNSRNILGLTPIDLSVDLGRNEMTFLLLSQRGPLVPNQMPQTVAKASGKGGKRVVAAQNPFDSDTPFTSTTRAAPISRQAAPAPPVKPRLFAGDGGSPVPQAGFLGFGAAVR